MTRRIRTTRHATENHGARPAAPPGNPGRGGTLPTDGTRSWLYGSHAVLAALANPKRRVYRIVATAELAPRATVAAAGCGSPRPPVETVQREVMSGLVPRDSVHQGILALVAPLEPMRLDRLLAEQAGNPASLVVVLDQVTDPRNVGAVMRSAAAFGACGVIAQDRHAPAEGAALAKAASGALEQLPLVRVTNIARTLVTLGEAGYQSLGLSSGATCSLEEAPLAGRLALVLGAEGKGLRRLVAERCDRLVRIPMDPAAESLNIAAAAAIALYVASRRLSEAAEGGRSHG